MTMKKSNSAKKRIALWYTLVIMAFLGLTIAGVLIASERYSQDEMIEELIDEVGDLQEDINNYPDYFPQSEMMAFYDDGIMLSIYDADGEFINGIIPDDFPVDYPFIKENVQKLGNEVDSWYIYDSYFTWEDGDIYWIRGINSYSPITHLIENLTKWILIVFPLLLGVIAIMGYRMVSRTLKPMDEMVIRVNEICDSSDLSLRLSEGEHKNEFSALTDTFNHMLDGLEEQFIREKQFASDAAHELRTPVSVIMSHCEYILDELQPGEEREELQIIYDRTCHMSELIDALLLIARTEKKNYQLSADDIDITVLAESVAEDMKQEADKKNISIKVSDHLETTLFTGDMTLLVRLFSNLISNGIKYGRTGGTVTVRLEETSSFYRFIFEDDGIGIPKDCLEKIWDRFYRVNDSRMTGSGFGLGLYMSRLIVRLHKGDIDVSSVYGEGSRFIVTLPKHNNTKDAD